MTTATARGHPLRGGRAGRHHHPRPARAAQRLDGDHERRVPGPPAGGRRRPRRAGRRGDRSRPGFCAGAESDDLAGHADAGRLRLGDADDLATPGYGVRPEFDAELAYHFGIPKPVLAAVNGPVAGIGFALACYCDLRFAAARRPVHHRPRPSRTALAFGLAWLLPKLIGLPRALDLLLSSRTFDADEAHDLGLVTAVVDGPDLLDHVYDYARLATTVSPASLAASKRQVYEAFHQTVAESVRAAEALLDPMMAGPTTVRAWPPCGRSAPRSSGTRPPADRPGRA